MRFIDLRKIQEKTGVIAFCGPSVLEHNINFELNARNITKGQLISLEMIEEHCKKSYLEVIIDAIIEDRSGLPGIQRILTSNNSLFKEIDFFDISQVIRQCYSNDNYNNNISGMELSGSSITGISFNKGVINRQNWSALYFDNFTVIITPIGGILVNSSNNESQILYINGIKKEHLPLASYTKGILGVTMFVNFKFQTLFDKIFIKYKYKLFYKKEIVDFTGAISTFTPNFSPSNYQEITKEFTNKLVETYLSELSPEVLEAYSKVGIKDYILDFGEEEENKIPEVPPIPTVMPTAPIVEERISLQDFLDSAGVVEGIENVEESIASDILSYITTLNLDEMPVEQPPIAAPRVPREATTTRNG